MKMILEVNEREDWRHRAFQLSLTINPKNPMKTYDEIISDMEQRFDRSLDKEIENHEAREWLRNTGA